MKNRKILLLLSQILSIRGQKKTDFSYIPVQICVFTNYTIKLSNSNFFIDDELGHIRYWIMIMNNVMCKSTLRFINKYAYLLINNYEKSQSEKESNKEVKKEKIEKLMTYVNYDGIENLTHFINDFNTDNKIIYYNILPLRITNETEKQELETSIKNMNEEELTAKFGLFPNIFKDTNQKHVLIKCKKCNKNEITTILQSMRPGQSQIIYLKSRGRYVYIKMLKIEDFSQISLDVFNYFYLKNGMSLLKNNKKAQEEYCGQLIHDFFCK